MKGAVLCLAWPEAHDDDLVEALRVLVASMLAGAEVRLVGLGAREAFRVLDDDDEGEALLAALVRGGATIDWRADPTLEPGDLANVVALHRIAPRGRTCVPALLEVDPARPPSIATLAAAGQVLLALPSA